MKKLLLVAALLVSAVSVQAQQLNLGVSGRRQYNRPVVDAVLMAPKIHGVIPYGQVSLPGLNKPEFTAALELPVVDTKHFYLGLDEGLGFYASDNKYGNGTWATGFTTWIPVKASYGAYGMLGATPLRGGSATIQFGIYKQLH